MHVAIKIEHKLMYFQQFESGQIDLWQGVIHHHDHTTEGATYALFRESFSRQVQHVKKGIRIPVFSLQSSQSYCPPHFLSAFSSKRVTPEMNLSNMNTKTGLMSAKYCKPRSTDRENMAAPIQMTISPKQLGCLEMLQRPTFINFPLFQGSSLNDDFWQSATTSKIKPTTQTTSPSQSVQLKDDLLAISLSVMTTSRVAMVKRTQSPWRSHVLRYLMKKGLMSLKRVSSPALSTLRKRKKPNRPDQMTTMQAAMICLASIRWMLVKVAMRVMEMQVKLPVISQNFSDWQMKDGMKAMI